MNTNLLKIVKQIVAEQGEGILSEPRRVSAFFADLAKDIPKPRKNAFVKCLEHGFAKILKGIPVPEQNKCKQQLAQRLHEEEGLDLGLCEETLELLAAVLFGEKEKKKTNLCKECGKELQKEWKVCPYCLTPLVKESQPISVASTATQLKQAALNMEMVRVSGGTFTMGSPGFWARYLSGEGPQHQVMVDSFYMGKYEVTQKEYQAVIGTNPSNFKGDNLPVECVSWYDAVEYCNKRSRKEGLTPAYTISGSEYNRPVTWHWNADGYRLPTEAEWEYACRAGTTTAYNTGASINDNTGWYKANSGDKTHPVGQKPANAWGLYDMHGNVYEWCWDWHETYSSGAQTDPTGASSGPYRVIRGGSWFNTAGDCRSASRCYFIPDSRKINLGFRVVRP